MIFYYYSIQGQKWWKKKPDVKIGQWKPPPPPKLVFRVPLFSLRDLFPKQDFGRFVRHLKGFPKPLARRVFVLQLKIILHHQMYNYRLDDNWHMPSTGTKNWFIKNFFFCCQLGFSFKSLCVQKKTIFWIFFFPTHIKCMFFFLAGWLTTLSIHIPKLESLARHPWVWSPPWSYCHHDEKTEDVVPKW